VLQFEQAFVSASQFGLAPFDLARPTTLSDLPDLLKVSATPCFLAGGTDLFVQFREGLRPDFVIDINGIEDLTGISREEDHLRIGAGVHHEDGVRHPLIAETVPGMEAAWSLFGNVRIRGMGTLGGNLMSRRERYEGPLLASVLSAKLKFLTADGEAQCSMEDVWTRDAPSGGLLTTISFPIAGRPRFAYDRTLRPVFTMAAAFEDASGGGLTGRAVMGFEWERPVTLELDLNGLTDDKAVAGSATDVATAAFQNFPATLIDAEYKKDAGTAVLARLLTQLGDGS